jgi:hypothetical protein
MVEGSKAFAEYFRKLYEAKEGKTPQVKVAEKFGTTQGAISKMLNGAMIPDDLAPNIIKAWSLDEKEFMENIHKFRKESGAKFFREAKKREEVEREVIVSTPTKPRLPVSAAAGNLSRYSQGVLLEQCEQVPVIRNFPDYD